MGNVSSLLSHKAPVGNVSSLLQNEKHGQMCKGIIVQKTKGTVSVHFEKGRNRLSSHPVTIVERLFVLKVITYFAKETMETILFLYMDLNRVHCSYSF